MFGEHWKARDHGSFPDRALVFAFVLPAFAVVDADSDFLFMAGGMRIRFFKGSVESSCSFSSSSGSIPEAFLFPFGFFRADSASASSTGLSSSGSSTAMVPSDTPSLTAVLEPRLGNDSDRAEEELEDGVIGTGVDAGAGTVEARVEPVAATSFLCACRDDRRAGSGVDFRGVARFGVIPSVGTLLFDLERVGVTGEARRSSFVLFSGCGEVMVPGT